MDSVDYTIVGGGVIGLAIAYYLVQKYPGKTTVVVEKNARLGEEQSTHNSGVLHAGWAYHPRSLKAELCAEGNRLLKQFALEHRVSYAETGKLVVACGDEEFEMLDWNLQRAIENRVPVQVLTQKRLREFEPNVKGIAGLYFPSAGIIDAGQYVNILEKLVEEQNGVILRKHEVKDVISREEKFVVQVVSGGRDYEFSTHLLINAAGLGAENIGKMINARFPYEIIPTKGEYMRFQRGMRDEIGMRGMCVYPLPQVMEGSVDEYGEPKRVLGNHLTPTLGLDGALSDWVLVGPLRGDINVTGHTRNRSDFVSTLESFFPGICEEDLRYDQIGIQAKLKNKSDFVIERDGLYPHALHVLADSPGLTASLAIGMYVVERLIEE